MNELKVNIIQNRGLLFGVLSFNFSVEINVFGLKIDERLFRYTQGIPTNIGVGTIWRRLLRASSNRFAMASYGGNMISSIAYLLAKSVMDLLSNYAG